MAHRVKCRICKQYFDAKEEEKDTVWIMPSSHFYYHKNCYEIWKKETEKLSSDKTDNLWIDYIYDYIAHDLKLDYDYFLIEAQRKKMIESKGYTNKGIFFALRYAYDVKQIGFEKWNGGIGIIPYLYQESVLYWANLQKQQKDILEKIEKQMRELSLLHQNQRIICRKKKNKKWIDKTEEILGGLNE